MLHHDLCGPVAAAAHTTVNYADLNTANAVNPPAGIFGVPLHESIIYANVAISLTNDVGESFIYGYVPIVVAKCGVFLKEKGKRCSAMVLAAVSADSSPHL